MAKLNAPQILTKANTRAEAICVGQERLDASRIGTLVLVAADQKGVSVDPASFKATLRGTSFDDLVPDPVKPHRALTRAIGNTKKGIRDDGISSQWSRVGETSDGRLVFALSRKYPDAEQRDLATTVCLTVEVRRDGVGGLTFNHKLSLRPSEVEELNRIEARYQKERGFLTLLDIRGIVNTVGLSKLRGIRLGGTVAFLLPAIDCEDEKFLKLAPGLRLAGIRMTPQEVFEGQRAGYQADVNVSLLDEVAALKESCEERLRAAKLTQDPQNPARFVWGTIGKRREEALALRQKITFFETFVGIIGDDLKSAVTACDRILDDTMAACAGIASELSQ